MLVFLFFFSSCFNQENRQNRENRNRIIRTLKDLSGKYILFGHQDDLAYGLGWKGSEGTSDVWEASGDYPVVFGWEVGCIGDSLNIFGLSFQTIEEGIKKAHSMGGINTVGWHARYPVTNNVSWNLTDIDLDEILPGGEYHYRLKGKLDLLADFFNRLVAEDGSLIPIVFRPFQEMYGNWFWWGQSKSTDDQYVRLYRFTVDYLRKEKGLTNLLFSFSPDENFSSDENYLERYPGDDYVDVLGFIDYNDFKDGRLDLVVIKLGIVNELAERKNKIASFSETGSDRMEIPAWYTSNLLQVLKANEKTRKTSWVMVWRNRDLDHFYIPTGDLEQTDDFRSFCNDKMILLLAEFNKLNNK
ncbi:MAG TPA: glycosyl hydrolase [Prolixibacteraceae bacterium]|nr:glycosyl hydrolase [Prolixibacteraceae bacterium]